MAFSKSHFLSIVMTRHRSPSFRTDSIMDLSRPTPRRGNQGCQIFLCPNIPKREKYTKLPQTIPNGHKIYQMAVKYSKWS
jgi:hypothetical protein